MPSRGHPALEAIVPVLGGGVLGRGEGHQMARTTTWADWLVDRV